VRRHQESAWPRQQESLADFFAAALGWSLRLGLEAASRLVELQVDEEQATKK
jgi:hypothetical protein